MSFRILSMAWCDLVHHFRTSLTYPKIACLRARLRSEPRQLGSGCAGIRRRIYETMYLVILLLAADDAAVAANLKIPAVAGALTVDGRLDEPLWREARSFSLNTWDFGAAFPAGGEIRIAGRRAPSSCRAPAGIGAHCRNVAGTRSGGMVA